jgi:hypothetical protein
MITSRRIRLAGHVVCLGEKRYTYTVMRDHFENLSIDGRII